MRLFPFFLVLLVFLKTIYCQNSDGIEQLLQKLTSTNDTVKINTLNTLAWALKQSDPQKALLYTNEALSQSKSLNYKQGQAKANKNLGVINWALGNYDQSLAYYKITLNIYSELGDQTETGNIYNLIGVVYWNKGDYKSAEKNYSKALTIFEKTTDMNGIAKSLTNLGIIDCEQGKLDKALEHYINAEKIKERQNDQYALAAILLNIGNIYLQQKNYSQALTYYTKCKETNLQIGDGNRVAYSYANIAASYFNLNNIDSAWTNGLRALKYFEETGNKRELAYTYDILGNIYEKKGGHQDALAQFEKALRLKQEIGEKKGILLTYSYMADMYRTNKNYDKALSHYKSVLSIAEEIRSGEYISQANYELSSIYEILKDYPNAYAHYKQYAICKDSIFNKENNDKLLDLQVEYETDKKEKEIELLNKEARIKESRSKLLYAVIGSLIIISSLVINFQALKKKKNKKILLAELEKRELDKKILKNEIHTKEQELEFNKNTLAVYTKNLVEKNHLLEDLKNTLQGLQVNYPEDHKKIEQINHLTSTKIITEDDWSQFKTLFENAYEGFFFKLKKDYTGITASELRLAALIKLHLSSKEIASIIGISYDSVKKTRQRLRKKMQLNTGEGLEEAIYKM